MYLVVGLGNPGKKFEGTRHNIGFDAILELAKRYRVDLSSKKKLQSIIGKFSFEDEDIILAMPQTFMNNSGVAVQNIIKNHPIDTHKIIVIHDEIDLPVGALRVKKDGGSAGHKGLESIVDHICSRDFIRIRIGVGHPRGSSDENVEGADYVLSKIPRSESKHLSDAVKKAADAVEAVIRESLSRAMNLFNKTA